MPEIAHAHKSNTGLFIKVCAAAVALSLAACSQPKPWGHEWDGWIKQPGSSVVQGKDAQGNDMRTIRLASGVLVRQTRNGDGIQSVEDDESGLGAVKCSAGIYLMVRSALDICSPSSDEALKDEVDDAIDRIDGFIAVNSVPPISKSDLEVQMWNAAEKSKEKISATSKAELRKACSAGDLGEMIHDMRKWPSERISNEVTRLLSVPRPAVLNPCM